MNTADALILDGLAAVLLVAPLKEVWIAIRTDGSLFDPLNPVILGDGTEQNPWDGSTALKFDYILRQKLLGRTNTTVRLGPGVFRTGGGRGAVGYDKWTPLSGWKIIGSGQYQTTLLLTPYGETAPSGVANYWIVQSGATYP